MLKTLRNALKIQDIRKRLIFTLLMLVVVRLGSCIPTPGVQRGVLENFFSNLSGSSGALDLFSALTGGSFENMSIFALSITPYITASIIMQLLTIAIPKLEEMQKEGEDGRKKIREITRYVNIGLSIFEGLALGINFARGGSLDYNNAFGVIVTVISLTAGSAFLMWIGEQITDRGVGNGISIVLLVNILSRLPQDIGNLYVQFIESATNIVHSRFSCTDYPCRYCSDRCVCCISAAGGKKNSGAVFQKSCRPQNLWRSVKSYSAESQYGRRYPGYFCIITDGNSGNDRSACGQKSGRCMGTYFKWLK